MGVGKDTAGGGDGDEPDVEASVVEAVEDVTDASDLCDDEISWLWSGQGFPETTS